jgi:hypothetical protein
MLLAKRPFMTRFFDAMAIAEDINLDDVPF